jgi:hypothetical protein
MAFRPPFSFPLFFSTLLTLSTALCMHTTVSATTPSTTALKVELRASAGNYQLYRDGKPYFIRGGGGSGSMDLLAASGGNSVRTWDTDDAGKVLDAAHQRGLSVMLGLRLGLERQGFDYDNAAAVQAQKEKIRAEILKYKDHPALLVWGIGNELDLFYKNPRVWYAVEDIAKMIKSLDPNHLVTTVVAGVDDKKLALIKERVPSMDYLSINIYGGLETLPQKLRELGWNSPYAVTEWGPTGHWETPKTSWNIPIEQTSTEKAASYRARYEGGIAGGAGRALGSYAFLWGQKQETTPTWYGVFLESGAATEVVDTLAHLWSGAWPAHRAPSISQFLINGKAAADNIHLEAGKQYPISLRCTHPQNAPLSLRWEILPESTDLAVGGDHESRPKSLPGLVTPGDGAASMQLQAPAKPGAYRLFAYAITGHNKAAVANIPFFVR